MTSCHDRRGRSSISAVLAYSRGPFDALCAAALRAWQWFLPERFSPEESDLALRVLAFCLGMSIWLPMSAIAYQTLGVSFAVHIILVAVSLLAAIPVLLRYGRCQIGRAHV